MARIVAIGGGEIADGETFEIDREIVDLTDTDDPDALFVPTASDDAEGYIETFEEVYGSELGCGTDVLRLIDDEPSRDEIREKIEGADLVYVGGGNTTRMMKVWGETGAGAELRRAYTNDKVLSGLSAGGICWFESGYGDVSGDGDGVNVSGEGDGWDKNQVSGLGFIENTVFCPHYSGSRSEDFQDFMAHYPEKVGFGFEDCAAIEITDREYRILTADSGASGYAVYTEDGNVVEEELSVSEPTPLDKLF